MSSDVDASSLPAADCSEQIITQPGRTLFSPDPRCGQLHLTLCGAGGGAGPSRGPVSQSAAGGAGGQLDLILSTVPQNLEFFVGAAGKSGVQGGESSGGGGGGGASYVADDNQEILGVAGGGGGASGDPTTDLTKALAGGAGGNYIGPDIGSGLDGASNPSCLGGFGGSGGFGGLGSGGAGGCNDGGGGAGGGAPAGIAGDRGSPGSGGGSYASAANLVFFEAGSAALPSATCAAQEASHGAPPFVNSDVLPAGAGVVKLRWQSP